MVGEDNVGALGQDTLYRHIQGEGTVGGKDHVFRLGFKHTGGFFPGLKDLLCRLQGKGMPSPAGVAAVMDQGCTGGICHGGRLGVGGGGIVKVYHNYLLSVKGFMGYIILFKQAQGKGKVLYPYTISAAA